MTREEIIKLAREIAAQCLSQTPSWQYDYAMRRIMELLDASAAAERAACAKEAEEFLTRGRSPLGRAVGDAIRTRGQA